MSKVNNAAELDAAMNAMLVNADILLDDIRAQVDRYLTRLSEGDPTLNWADAGSLGYIVEMLSRAAGEE